MDGDMYGQVFHDESKTFCCPICRHESELRFVEVPAHRRHFTAEDGTECVEHMPALRDYTCSDCGWQWAQDVQQELD